MRDRIEHMKSYLEPTEAAGLALIQRGLRGPVVMLNLLRFRAVADYSTFPDIAPAAPIGGAEAYDRFLLRTSIRHSMFSAD
jgi:hypothetical protein